MPLALQAMLESIASRCVCSIDMEEKRSVQICIPIRERSFAGLKASAEAATRFGDLIELRLDGLDEDQLEIADAAIDEWLPSLGCPVIVTLRPAGQGGLRPLEMSYRREFVYRRRSATLLDIELDLAEALIQDQGAEIDWSRIICSYHDFDCVPDTMQEIYQRLARTPARVLKIAAQANDATDCLPLFKLLDRARKDGREMIAIAMGPCGLATRIFGLARGSFLTYGALSPGRGTGPGQLTADELNHLYRIRSIDRNTQITGLAGRPVSHSISPSIHNSGFAALGLNAVYIPFEIEDVGAFIKRMVHPATRELDWNFRGLSVTAPHKTSVMAHLDWIAPAALEIGAVNTIVCEQEKLRGYNTDGAALIQPLIEKLETLDAARCAVIGAGGAARAALWALKQNNAVTTLFARNVAKAEKVATDFGVRCKDLNHASFSDFDVVINATPLGTNGARAAETPAVAKQLEGVRVAYDLVYNPAETLFLSEARAAGCDSLPGLAMLVSQAFEQFRLWTGIDAPRDVMRDAAVKALNNG